MQKERRNSRSPAPSFRSNQNQLKKKTEQISKIKSAGIQKNQFHNDASEIQIKSVKKNTSQ
jgi:hypothetical protein